MKLEIETTAWDLDDEERESFLSGVIGAAETNLGGFLRYRLDGEPVSDAEVRRLLFGEEAPRG